VSRLSLIFFCFIFLLSYSFISSLFLHFCLSVLLLLTLFPIFFVIYIVPFLHYFCIFHNSFLCSPGSWFPTCIYLLLSLLFNILLSLILFSLFFFLLLFSSLLLCAFPVVPSCFSRDYQTCTSQCSANHAFFPSSHDLSSDSFGCTFDRKYMQYH